MNMSILDFDNFLIFRRFLKFINKGKRLLVNNESSFESANQEPLINPRLMYPKREMGKEKIMRESELRKIELQPENLTK